MITQLQQIANTLSVLDTNILHVDEEEKTIYTEDFIIWVEEPNNLIISFFIGMAPLNVATIILELRDLEDFDIFVSDSHYVTHDKKMIFGSEACDEYRKMMKECIIRDYKKEIYENNVLKYADDKSFYSA